jgi:hypothetical protein
LRQAVSERIEGSIALLIEVRDVDDGVVREYVGSGARCERRQGEVRRSAQCDKNPRAAAARGTNRPTINIEHGFLLRVWPANPMHEYTMIPGGFRANFEKNQPGPDYSRGL